MDVPENLPKTEDKEKFTQVFGETIEAYMEKYKIGKGSGCVMKGEQVLAEIGFGTEKDSVFRIASITKLFTRVAIHNLIDRGLLSLDSAAFPSLDLDPLPNTVFNPELNELPQSDDAVSLDQTFGSINKITIDDLINHRTGWDQNIIGDITFDREGVAKAFGKDPKLITPTDMVRVMLDKPLQYEPGTGERTYCNFGYAVLGRVIEKISGKSYIDFIREELTLPLGLTSINLAHEDPDSSYPKEVDYEKDSSGENPNEDPYQVPLEMADSCGGLVSNALDLAKFLNHYWGTGLPRQEQLGRYFYMNGRCCGTLTLAVQRKDGLNYVVLFNNRHNRDNKKDDELRISIEASLDQVLS
jgi:CubicO group peptidase (beta-lactamase class C family)